MMNSNTAFKAIAALGLTAAAAFSSALSFTTEQIGNFTASTSGGTTTFSSTFNVFTTQSNPAGVSFAQGTFSYTEAGTSTAAGTPVSGVIRVIGSSASDYLEFALTGTIYGAGSAEAVSFSSTLSGEGGIFSSYNSGAGVGSTQILTLASSKDTRTGTTFGSFSADVQAVPEPVSIAALSLGVVGLIARRRKA